MQLIPDWKAVLVNAWSVRLIVLSILFDCAAVFLSMVDATVLGIDPIVFAAISTAVKFGAVTARLIAQQNLPSVGLNNSVQNFLKNESGAVSKKAAGLSMTGALVIAMAMPVISHWEGRELKAYRDIVGVWTICDGETFGVQPGDVATHAECDAKLAKRVKEFHASIQKCLPANLPPHMQAAFTSAAYNIGVRGFCGSSMARRARSGDLIGACHALLMWDKARVGPGGQLRSVRGLTNRRIAESKLCLEGAKSA